MQGKVHFFSVGGSLIAVIGLEKLNIIENIFYLLKLKKTAKLDKNFNELTYVHLSENYAQIWKNPNP